MTQPNKHHNHFTQTETEPKSVDGVATPYSYWYEYQLQLITDEGELGPSLPSGASHIGA